jgi:hypothetical protein
MASVAVSNISNITSLVTGTPPKGSALTWPGGIPIVIFRIASGQVAGDTAVLSDPIRLPLIKAVLGPVTHTLPISGASSVTVTIAAVTGSAITVTVGAIEVWAIGPQPIT